VQDKGEIIWSDAADHLKGLVRYPTSWSNRQIVEAYLDIKVPNWRKGVRIDGGGGPETDKERADRLEAEKKAYEAKLTALASKVRKQREALERQPGKKGEGKRRENLAVYWLKTIGYVDAKRTSPKAPGFDIVGTTSTGEQHQFEVKPKGELITDPEAKFAEAHKATWRLIEFNRKTGKFRMFTYDQLVWRSKLQTVWRANPVPHHAPRSRRGSFHSTN
jgi:hypothetical protein